MGRSVNAQENRNSEYVRAVKRSVYLVCWLYCLRCKLLHKRYQLRHLHSTHHISTTLRLIVLSDQALLFTPSLSCSFTATYPRPAPVWPCSSVCSATVICSGGRGFECNRGQRLLLFLRVGPFPFWGYRSEDITWDIHTVLQLSTFKPLYKNGKLQLTSDSFLTSLFTCVHLAPLAYVLTGRSNPAR